VNSNEIFSFQPAGRSTAMEIVATCSDILEETSIYDLMCRYDDRYYIRFTMDDGFIAELPVSDIPTGFDVVKRIREKPEEMIKIVNSFRKKGTWNENSYLQSTLTDHLLYSGDMPMRQAAFVLKRLNNHEDILHEMYNMIVEGKPGFRVAKECGYTAADLMEATSLNLIGAYLFLISLREDPENASVQLENMILEKKTAGVQ
jgi:hypothetical protein